MPSARKKQKPNPLNDNDYSTNDPQIEDLKELVHDLAGALENADHQIGQMEGMFDDEDNQIAQCRLDIRNALKKFREP